MIQKRNKLLFGWGKFPKKNCLVSSPRNIQELISSVKSGSCIARGNGRSYGDSSINEQNTILMKNLNKMISFNFETGQLVAESGVLLSEIIEVFLKKGWFPYVSPGTKFATLGGMIASDVHGKNHHIDGSMGNYVDWIDLLDESGNIINCSLKKNKELFLWTIGGMGLTGIIVRAAIRLRPIETGWIEKKTIPANNLDHVIDIFEKYSNAPYSVAWIDCLKKGENLGRSLVMMGKHSNINDLPLSKRNAPFKTKIRKKIKIPFDFPSWFLSSWTVSIFNEFYFQIGKRNSKKNLVAWDQFFYPLDSIHGWNRIYGKKGFIQFQCVLPLSQAKEGLNKLLQETSNSNLGSFLGVLKKFGGQMSKFSFPMEGYTLALDFHVNEKSLKLINRMERIVIDCGGRFYLTKDSLLSRKVHAESDNRVNDFQVFRKNNNMKSKFVSLQSKRLEI